MLRVYEAETTDSVMRHAVQVSVLFGSSASVLAVDDPVRLSPGELARANQFRYQTDRDDYVAAHLLLRRCVAGLLDMDVNDVGIVQSCNRCGGPHGRPRLVGDPSLALSLAHTRAYVAVAAGGDRVGVDIENRAWARGAQPAGVLSAAEQRWTGESWERFCQVWVRKEAIVKSGLASLDSLASVDLMADGRLVSEWDGLPITGWEHAGIVGACLSDVAPVLVDIDRATD